MLPLYDHTRRQICTLAFVGLCVLPTVAITAGGIARRLPWHQQAEEKRLAQELGLDVSLKSMEHVQPGVVRYTGLKLGDPETGRELFRCLELVATWTSMTDAHGQTRPAIVLAATRSESPVGAWSRLNEVLRRRLECQGGRPEIEIRVTADQWNLHDDKGSLVPPMNGSQIPAGDESQIVLNVEGGIGLRENGIEAQWAFRLPGASSRPVRMRVVRNRQVSPPANGFDLDTGPDGVPCRLLATYCKEIAMLGASSRFLGQVSINDTPGGWSGQLDGRLIDVDLGRLTQDSCAAPLTGTAEITLFKATFQRGRIDRLNGRIVCGPGMLSKGTLAALVTHLRLTPSSPAAAGQPLSYDCLGLDFWIDDKGVSIAGCCPGAAGIAGAVATAAGRVVLSEPAPPAAQRQEVAALIEALVPADEARFPATRQAAVLARLLPLPDAANAN